MWNDFFSENSIDTSDQSLFERAVEFALQDGQISSSTLMRRMKIGYARAGRLVDEMERRGIVSAANCSKPRLCLISRNTWEDMLNRSRCCIPMEFTANNESATYESKDSFKLSNKIDIKHRHDEGVIKDLLFKYDEAIRFHSFGGLLVRNEKDESDLQDKIIHLVKDANFHSDPIIAAVNLEQKNFYDSLVKMGVLVRVNVSEPVRAVGNRNISAVRYRCIVSDEEIESVFEKRLAELNDQSCYDINRKINDLYVLINEYNAIRNNVKIKTAIENSKDIIYAADIYDMNILATPLEPNFPPRYIYRDGKYLCKDEKSALLFGAYRPKYIFGPSITISDERSFPAEYIRLEKYIKVTFSSIPAVYMNDQLELVDIWGSIIHHTYYRNGSKFNKEAAEEFYAKIIYLYDSLCEYGLIVKKGENTLQAFLLLVYQVWLDWIKNDELVQLISKSSLSVEDSFRRLCKAGLSFDQATWVVARSRYLIENIVSVKCLRDRYKKMYYYVYAEEQSKENKRNYIESLIEGKSNSGVCYNIDDTDGMNGFEFEELITKLFKTMGYEAYTTKKTGDQGVDVIAVKGITKLAIQTKCYPNSVVGNEAVQEVVAGSSFYKATKAVVITNSTYTSSAHELADANNVELWSRKELKDLLEKYHVFK